MASLAREGISNFSGKFSVKNFQNKKDEKFEA